MVALAIIENATDIALFGVDMAQSDPTVGQNGEYEHQRPSCEFFCGFAAGRGCKVWVPKESDLLKCPRLYAFESDNGDNAIKNKARKKELKDQLALARANKAKLEQDARDWQLREHVLMGAIDDNDYWRQRV